MVGFSSALASASASEIVALLTRAEFVADFVRELDVEDHRSTVQHSGDTVRHDLQLTFSTNGIPRVFERIVPKKVIVDWRTTWTPVGDGSYSSVFEANSQQPQASFAGHSTLRTSGSHTRWDLDGRTKAQRSGLVPASLIEAKLKDLVTEVLADQVEVAQRWLATA